MQPVISIKDLLLCHDKGFRLSIESLDLHQGQIYALTGPNGSGKSTLLRIMALLSLPQKGKVRFAGADSVSLTEQRQKVTLVEQSPYLFQGTVSENLLYGLKLRGVEKDEQSRRIKLMLSIVGLEGFEQRMAKELSGGEIQRVALARALVFKPDLLLLDEPTANIDSNSLQAFEALLSKLPRYGVTVVFSTHDLSQSDRLGAELLQIENGHLINRPNGASDDNVLNKWRNAHG